MRNSSCEASAIRDWLCMQRAPSRHGSGRPTAPGFCGPIRSAPGCSAQPTARRWPKRFSVRRERLRGFGAALGTLITCGCARLEFADGSHGVLVVAAEPVGRAMPLIERLQRLVEGIDTPIAAFARDGMFVGASDAARSLPGFRNLAEAGLDQARSDALKEGRFEAPIGLGHLVLQRVGAGADVGLVALIAPRATPIAHCPPNTPPIHVAAPAEPAHPSVAPAADYEQPAM